MTQYERELSNLSYTNKDFQTIYPELLDLTRKLSYKWDPRISDESDPGVVLLKLVALMADKLNYNIDKNILELYPLSVTQMENARQIFEQIGYNMHHYQSATTTVSITMVNEPEIKDDSKLYENIEYKDESSLGTRIYKIPKFSMVSSSDNSFVYTLLKDVDLKSTRETEEIPAIQGVATKLTINGEKYITPEYLDYNNRIYFPDLDVAENGIYINNVGDTFNWEKVDNLLIHSYGTKCYKFGVSIDGSRCFIEFPSDIDSIIGNGLEITYVRTMGKDGNVGKRFLTKLFNIEKLTRCLANNQNVSEEVTIESDNIYITNLKAATNGEDIETIDDAYRAYQKVKNTFDTLVSTKDYTNFIINEGVVSNGFVCDRVDDVQDSYKLCKVFGDSSSIDHIVEKDTSGNDLLNAFDIKLYGFQNTPTVTTGDGYKKSFSPVRIDVVDNNDWNSIFGEVKCIQHNVKEIEQDKIIMLKNKFPIKAKIIPTYKLTVLQQADIIGKVNTSLCTALNSKKISFSDRIEYDFVYDTIMESDPRIKALILENIEYKTFVVFLHKDEGEEEPKFYELQVDSTSESPSDAVMKNLYDKFRAEIYSKAVLAGATQLFNENSPFNLSLNQKNISIIDDIVSVSTFVNKPADREEHSDLFKLDVNQNENIIFTAPNLITDREFSTYAKMFHNIGGDVTSKNPSVTKGETVLMANEEYKLKPGEYIVFFWKKDEKENYTYLKYTSGTKIKGIPVNVVSPTYNLQTQLGTSSSKESYDRTLFDNVVSSLVDGVTTLVPDSLIVDTTTGLTLNNYVKDFSSADMYVLTGTNMIYTKKLNQVNISDQTKKAYWITKNIENIDGEDKYVLNLSQITNGSYILQSGEYFLYSNNTGSQLIMLGSGTKIDFSGIKSGSKIYCDYISYDELIENGVSILNNHNGASLWYNIPSNSTIIATEMLYKQIGSGCNIEFNFNESISSTDKFDKLIIKHDGVYYINGGVEDKLNTLSVFDISYSDGVGDTIYLEKRRDTEIGWNARSILNINCNNNKSQVILDYQAVSFIDKNDKIYTINGDKLPNAIEGSEEVGSHESHQYLACSLPTSITGGNLIDVTQMDYNNGIKKPVSFAIFDTQVMYDADGNEINHNDSDSLYMDTISKVELNFKENKTENIPVKLPVGNYLLKIATNKKVDSMSISTSGEVSLDSFYKNYAENGLESGNYFYTLEVTNKSDENKLIIDVKLADGEEASISIMRPIKFEFEPYIGIPSNEELLSKVIDNLERLDVDRFGNHCFDYSYKLPAGSTVKNPLDSTTFFDENHPYNQFTIGCWDIDYEGLEVVTNIK